MIQLRCPNLDHASYDLESVEFTDLGSWIMIDRVDSIIVSSSHNMSAINFHALLWHQPPELCVGCVYFYT